MGRILRMPQRNQNAVALWLKVAASMREFAFRPAIEFAWSVFLGLLPRPPLSNERLSLLPDGRLLYKLKRRWSDGTTNVIYKPMELMERLAALVPPPRFNDWKPAAENSRLFQPARSGKRRTPAAECR
jgi:hypothetical protein